MIITSRTPEGEPNRCPVCGARILLEPSEPTRDAPCPACGHLLWWHERPVPKPNHPTPGKFALFDRILGLIGVGREAGEPERLDKLLERRFDTIEQAMELEEEFGITIPDEDAEKITTVAQAVEYLTQKRHQNEQRD